MNGANPTGHQSSAHQPDHSKNSNKTRLLVVCPKGSFDSGGIISNFQLIQYLTEKGYEVKVITSWQGSYNTMLTKHGIKNKTIAYNWWAPRDTPKDISTRAMMALTALVAEINSYKPQVVITNTSHIPWGALAASMTNTPHIWTVREYPIKNFEYLADRVEFIKQYSNRIMVNSKELANYYKQHYDADVGQFISYVDVSDIKLGTDSTETKLVSPNYMSVGKNQIELIEAVGILRKRRADLKFRVLLMGEKEKTYWPKLQAALVQNKVADIIDIYDRVENPWGMVGKHDILIQTSLSESIGRTTTEAMKLCIPVIASDIPGHQEAFSLGGGTLYEVGNSNDLADKIEYLLDHPAEIQKKSATAQKKALKNMSSEASNGPFLKALEQVIGQENPVGVNRLVWPYLSQFIQDYKQREKDLVRKNTETDTLFAAVEEIRNSRAYKLGRKQTNGLKKIVNVMQGLAGKK